MISYYDHSHSYNTDPLTNGSCRELFVNASQKTSGYYRIYPGGQNEFTVFCDMNTNVINRTGDGWTVILRRLDSGLPSFNKTWKEYRNGFGSLNDSFWLGLKKINQLVSHNLTNCSNTTHQLYVGMERFHPTNPYKSVFYNIFTIGDESTNFTLNVNTTNGVSSYNTGLSFSAAVVADALAPHSGLQFSTYDQDNDNHSTVHCANTHGGGWWYRSCIHGHLTGMFYSTGYDPENNGIFWQGLTTDNESLKQAVMAIRPVCND